MTTNGTDERRQQLVESLRDREYRDAFVASHIAKGTAFKIRAMRKARGWTQTDLSRLSGLKPETISRLEHATQDGNFSIRTLKRLAAAFDVVPVVDFIPYSEFVDRMLALSAAQMAVPCFEDDLGEVVKKVSIVGADGET